MMFQVVEESPSLSTATTDFRLGQYAMDTETNEALPISCSESQIQTTAICGLRCSKELCSDLARSSPSEKDSASAQCLGFIDVQSEDAFRHFFYPQSGPLLSNGPVSRGLVDPGGLVSLDELLSPDKGRVLTCVEKLRHAHFLVKTVVQFHATPRMREV